MKRIVKLEECSECARVVGRADRRMIIKLRGGTAGFQIETGRWRGVPDRREHAGNATVVKWKMWIID